MEKRQTEQLPDYNNYQQQLPQQLPDNNYQTPINNYQEQLPNTHQTHIA